MSGRPDVLVLGGGPAGAATAALCASAGARTLLLERERFPRDKVCGEFLSPEGVGALRRLGILAALCGGRPPAMDEAILSDRDGRRSSSPLPEIPGAGRAGLGLSRSRMDAAILEEAARRGVEVRERCEAVEPILDRGRVSGARLRSGESLLAGVVVAADGRRSIVQRALAPGAGDPRRTTPRSWYGFKAHFSRGRAASAAIELHLFDGGYAGIGAVEDDRDNLCFLATVGTLRACAGSPERILVERILRNPAARARLSGSRRCSPWKSVGPLRFGARRPVLSGAFLVGDAAGTIDPFTGEGMSHALTGAEALVPFLLRGDAEGWEREWRRRFGAPTRRNRAIGLLFERPRLGGAALRAIGSGALLRRLVAASRTGVSLT